MAIPHYLLLQFPGPNEKGIQYDTEAMEKYPRFERVWASPFVPVLMLYHPDLVRLLLKSSGQHWIDHEDQQRSTVLKWQMCLFVWSEPMNLWVK